jgi:hypothetical protein
MAIMRINNLTQPPVIIGGAPRSGTTLLSSILDSHPEITMIPYETMLFKASKNNWIPGWVKTKWIILRLNALLITLNIGKQARMWSEKTPGNIKNLDTINTIFKGRVKFIHIVRDGRDVILSKHPRLGYFINAESWAEYVLSGLLWKDKKNMLTIRYEDLILNFEDETNKIIKFLHLNSPFDAEFYRHTSIGKSKSIIDGVGHRKIFSPKNLNPDSIGKWKSHKDDERVATFEKDSLPKELLSVLGYLTKS